jgi:hypothetical protein
MTTLTPARLSRLSDDGKLTIPVPVETLWLIRERAEAIYAGDDFTTEDHARKIIELVNQIVRAE